MLRQIEPRRKNMDSEERREDETRNAQTACTNATETPPSRLNFPGDVFAANVRVIGGEVRFWILLRAGSEHFLGSPMQVVHRGDVFAQRDGGSRAALSCTANRKNANREAILSHLASVKLPSSEASPSLPHSPTPFPGSSRLSRTNAK